MAIGMNTTVRDAWLTEIVNDIDAGTGAGKIRIYDGTQPATGGTATTLLAELTLNDPCGTVSGQVLTIDVTPQPQDASADNTGTATWFRIVDSDNNFVCDGTVTATGGGGDLELSSTSITAGDTVTLTSLTITAPNA